MVAFGKLLGFLSSVCPGFITSYSGLITSYPSFESWMMYYNVSYNGATERDYRQSVYTTNVKRITEHNMARDTWTMAVNRFADLTGQEFYNKYVNSGIKPNRTHTVATHFRIANAPVSVDWLNEGAVTPVKDQGLCHASWAFSTTGAVESAWFLSNGTLMSLSEQQLVDCSTKEGNNGFQYVIDNNGLTTEEAYPYVGSGPNKCQSFPLVATIKGVKDVPTDSEPALLAAIAQQPVSIAIEADQNAFQFYNSGVMTAPCGTNLDHGVLAVGYGTLNSLDYYKVKNSWGSNWGDGGYILLARGAAYNPHGQCGIQMAPSYPVV